MTVENNLRRAACYIRVSTDDQIEYSPDSQLREMRAYAEKNGLCILDAHVYIDEGISGRKAATRPRFQAMLHAAGRSPRPFDVLLLYKFSRFARNREDSVVYKSMLRKKYGIDVVSISEPLDADNKLSIILEAFIEAMDEYYSVNLSEDVRRTMTEKALRGELQSPPPFGYTAKDNRLVPVLEEAWAVREIFARFARGESPRAIAQELNAMGFRTRRGRPFEARAIAYILNNPVYCGMLHWNPAGHTGRAFDNPALIVVPATHDPLVSKDLWDRATARRQALRTARAVQPRAPSGKDWLSGLVTCAHCGASLIKAGRYLRCAGYAKGRCPESQHIAGNRLRAAILGQLRSDLCAQGLVHTGRTVGQTAGVHTDTAQMLQAIDRRLLRARDAYLAGADTLDEYIQQKDALLAQRAALLQDAEAAEAAESDDPDALLAQALDLLGQSDPALYTKQCTLIRSIVRGAVYDRKRGLLTIEYLL